MASSIIITFNSIPGEADDDGISIIDTGLNINMYEVFQDTRTGFGTTAKGTTTSQLAFNFSQAFSLDWNNTSLYTVSVSGNVVTITANNLDSQFDFVYTTGAVSAVIDNQVPPSKFNIETLVISEALTGLCDNFRVTVTTNEQADSIISPFSQSITTNPYIFQINRSANKQEVTLVKDGESVTQKIRVPLLLESYFKINILTTPSSGNISVEKLPPLSLTSDISFEYSIDNINWQTSNYFNNIPSGDYFLYVRDNLGCSIFKGFSINEFSANVLDYDAVADISNLNSIRYKEDVIWDSYTLKTPDNTLSFEEDLPLKNQSYTQPFLKSDTVTTQVKTNYETVEAKIIDKDGLETPLSVTKMTANMNVTDVRDVAVLSTSYNNSDYTSLKFSGGKTYNPETLEELSDYNIGANVPDWINKDDYINLEGVGWYKVLDVIYSIDAYVVVVNQLFVDFPFVTPITIKATTVYNVLDYENYEFNCDFSSLEGFYKVQVNLSDSSFGNKQYLSEWLNIKETHPNTVLIEAYNSENNEINYNTGIKHRIRIPLSETIKWKPSSEIEVYVTDTNTVNLDTKYRGFWDLSARPLPTKMAEKLVLLLLQDRLFINTVNYISEGEPESNPVGGQYQIKASLVKSNYVYELYSGKGEITIETNGTPLSISPNGGFLLVD